MNCLQGINSDSKTESKTFEGESVCCSSLQESCNPDKLTAGVCCDDNGDRLTEQLNAVEIGDLTNKSDVSPDDVLESEQYEGQGYTESEDVQQVESTTKSISVSALTTHSPEGTYQSPTVSSTEVNEEKDAGSSCGEAEANNGVEDREKEEEVEDEGEGEDDDDEFGGTIVTTVFQSGPLGVTLRRRASDGIVFIHDVVEGSQAVGLDVQPGDELWSVGPHLVCGAPLDKEGWTQLIQFIKDSPRPLTMTWKRYSMEEEQDELEGGHREGGEATLQCCVTASSGDTSKQQQQQEEEEHTKAPSRDASEGTEHAAINAAEEGRAHDEPAQHSEHYRALEKILSKIVSKDKKQALQGLLQEGRALLKSGEVSLEITGALWIKSQSKRMLYLLTDVLLVTIPQANGAYQLEHIIDLQACKLRSVGQVFGGGRHAPNDSTATAAAGSSVSAGSSAGGGACFDLLWPGGSLALIASSREEKEVWVLNLFLAICARVDDGGKVLGWRHQYMLGTMHAAVLSRDESRVRELVQLCEDGELDFAAIDTQDEDGYTPLHYACMLRMQNMVRALHEATADVTAPDHRGLTPLHWAALQLDDYSLSLLCAHVFDLDLEDTAKRTPLYMACVEGRDVGGVTDPMALMRCVSNMLSHQPNVNIVDSEGFSLLHYVAASWQFETVDLLLQAGADVHARCRQRNNMTVLHVAAAAFPLKAAMGLGTRILQQGSRYYSPSSESDRLTPNSAAAQSPPTTEQQQQPTRNDSAKSTSASGNNMKGGVEAALLSASTAAVVVGASTLVRDPFFVPEQLRSQHGADTLRSLLRAGAYPNAKDALGRSPLHLLAEADREDQAKIWSTEELQEAVTVLLSFGARVDETSPFVAALKQRLGGGLSFAALMEKWNSLSNINGDELNMIANHFLSTADLAAAAIGGNGAAAAAVSPSGKRTTSTTASTIVGGNTAAAGGSSTSGSVASSGANQSECLLCSTRFTLFKRPHHCRFCGACCCDDCSKKRVSIEGSPLRCCDSCFNLAMQLRDKKMRENVVKNMRPIPKKTNAYVEQQQRLQQQQQQEQEQQQRSALFNGAAEDGQQQQKGASAVVSVAAQSGMDKTMAGLRETRERLEERGEKLNRAAERSEQMASQANEFAKLARQLNEQQKSRWF